MKRLAPILAFAPLPLQAQLPEGACFTLTDNPGSGVAALAIEFRPLTAVDRAAKGPWRHLRIAARMAPAGQGLRDGVAGQVLTATADCRTDTLRCFSDGDTSELSIEVVNSDLIVVRTSGFAVAQYGEGTGLSDLAPSPGIEARYPLTRSAAESCSLE